MITQKSFGCNTTLSNTYTISSSGTYLLCNDIVFNWTDPNSTGTIQNAIVISASNVTLDLNNKTLSQNGAGIAIGILVSPGVSNVTIKNGTVRYFKGIGIRAKGCDTLHFDDLNVLNNGTSIYDQLHGKSIWAAGVALVDCSNIYMQGCKVNENSDTGLVGGGVTNLQVNNCSFDNNTAPLGACRGMLFVCLPVFADFAGNTKGIFVKNSSFVGSLGRDCAFGYLSINFAGIINDILIEDCVVSNIVNNGNVPMDPPDPGILRGILIEGSSNVTIRNCEVFDVVTQRLVPYEITSTISDTQDNGFVLPTSTINVASTTTPYPFRSTGALYVQTTTGIATVFYTGINGNQFTGCTGGSGTMVSGGTVVQNTTTTVVTGIDLTGCSNGVIEGCTVESVGGKCLKAAGINIGTSGNNIVIKDCNVMNVNNTNTVDPTTIVSAGIATVNPYTNIGDGFQPKASTGIIVDGCTVNGVRLSGEITIPPPETTSGGTYRVSAGFLVNGVTSPVITNCVSTNNDLGMLVYDFNSAFLTTNGKFESNEFLNNTLGGVNDCTVASSTSVNAYTNNYARSNGNQNYLGLPAFTPIASWDIFTGPAPVVTKLTNMDITP